MMYTELRRQLDYAITFGETIRARAIADIGLERAVEEENLGEIMYFRAQHAILGEDFAAAARRVAQETRDAVNVERFSK